MKFSSMAAKFNDPRYLVVRFSSGLKAIFHQLRMTKEDYILWKLKNY
jgi:hypothetical protein